MRSFITGCLALMGSALIAQTTHKLELMQAPVNVVVHDSGKPGPLYYNMHDNEQTSVDAALKVVKSKGGVLCELVHSGRRNIEFTVDTVQYAIDPNRIYTDAGVWRELDRNGHRDSVVFQEIRDFGDTLRRLMHLDARDIVIALHNNSDCRYCLYSYTEGGDYETDAEATFRGKWEDPDEFYFVTEHSHFNALQKTGFNIVLQNNETVTDDGSLSVYCGQRGIEYINVEAEHGHVKQQKRMIKRMLKELKRLDR